MTRSGFGADETMSHVRVMWIVVSGDKTVTTVFSKDGCNKLCLLPRHLLLPWSSHMLYCNVTLSLPISFPLLESDLTFVTYFPNRRWQKWCYTLQPPPQSLIILGLVKPFLQIQTPYWRKPKLMKNTYCCSEQSYLSSQPMASNVREPSRPPAQLSR